jgi:hypothetical protein
MNKLEIRNAARTITELDVSDVSDATIDLYIKDGYDRIIAMERRWPFFEGSATFVTVAGQRDYPIDTVGGVLWREITSLLNTAPGGERLELISYDKGEQTFIADWDIQVGEPRFWSLWAGNVQLWPTPISAQTFLVRGYRRPNDWHLSDGTPVDCDERFHRSLIYYAIAQLYQLQEDAEMSSFYRATFEEAVRLVRADVMRVASHVPLILSGGDPNSWRYSSGWLR